MEKDSRFFNKNILIVDDNKANILFLKAMFEDEGYTSILSCLSANDAYEVLKEETIDLILLDVIMPDIDGIEACKTIRKMPEHQDTPIIMVTGDESDETLEKSFEAGADDFTTKPIHFINLNTRIKSVLSLREKDLQILNQTRYSAMNDIIDTLSNQWKIPLAAISDLTVDLNLAYKSEKLTKQIMENTIKNISQYTKELSKTIDEFTKVTKIEKKAQETDISKLIRYTLKVIQNAYQNNDITIQTDIQEDMVKILVYPNELIRAILNILINSQEAFVLQNKNKNKAVQLIVSQDENLTSIIIRDNAGGIKESNISKVFDPFFSTKDDKKGKGLGLYNSKQVIEEHMDGKVEVSTKNGITEFIIMFIKETEDVIVEEDEVFSLEEELDKLNEDDKKDTKVYDKTTKSDKKDKEAGIEMEDKEVDETQIEELDLSDNG